MHQPKFNKYSYSNICTQSTSAHTYVGRTINHLQIPPFLHALEYFQIHCWILCISPCTCIVHRRISMRSWWDTVTQLWQSHQQILEMRWRVVVVTHEEVENEKVQVLALLMPALQFLCGLSRQSYCPLLSLSALCMLVHKSYWSLVVKCHRRLSLLGPESLHHTDHTNNSHWSHWQWTDWLSNLGQCLIHDKHKLYIWCQLHPQGSLHSRQPPLGHLGLPQSHDFGIHGASESSCKRLMHQRTRKIMHPESLTLACMPFA